MATWKLNIAHVYISGLEVPNLQVLKSLFHQKKQKGFIHLLLSFCESGFMFISQVQKSQISKYRYLYFTKRNKMVLPIDCNHFANLEGTRGACFVFSDISTSYLTPVQLNLSSTTQQPTLLHISSDLIFPECLSNYSSRITNPTSHTSAAGKFVCIKCALDKNTT